MEDFHVGIGHTEEEIRSSFVKQLGEWTKVSTLIRQGKRNYIQAAIKAGWVQWLPYRSQQVEIEVVVEDPSDETAVQVTEHVEEMVRRPIQQQKASKKDRRRGSRNRHTSPRQQLEPKQQAAVSSTTSEAEPGEPGQYLETGDYFHTRGWP